MRSFSLAIASQFIEHMPLREWADPIAGDARQQGAHMLEVTRYSTLLHRRRRGVGVGAGSRSRCVVESAGFTVGGYQWAILFCPDGDDDDAPGGSSGYVSVSLALLTRRARVRASFNLGLVNRATGQPSFQPEDTTAVFDNAACCHCRMYPYPIPTCRHERNLKRSCHGVPRLMTRRELEASPAYLRDDAVTVACVVTGVTGTALTTPRPRGAPPEIRRVPPEPNLHLHIGELLVSQEGADVTFDVDGEAFTAHRIILAARSPVFEAELYGSTSTNTDTDDAVHSVTVVRDMRPDTFRALLHFIYIDSMPPAMGQLGVDEMRELAQHLLAAADRYAIDRLKVMCEHILARTLHAENAASTLVLADRHGCDRLKHASIHFIASSDKGKMGDDDVAIEALELEKIMQVSAKVVSQF